MSEISTTHGTFVIERTYPATPSRVFGAWADPSAKASWFGPPEAKGEHSLDFCVGGTETLKVNGPDGVPYTFAAEYRDIVPDGRIVYVYEMYRGEQRMSVSVACVEFEPVGEGTKLVMTEQGVFLDGLDTLAVREDGTKPLLEALAAHLESGEGHR